MSSIGVGRCVDVLQCAAVHEMKMEISEMNTKITTLCGMLQLFFDSWKQCERNKLQETVNSASEQTTISSDCAARQNFLSQLPSQKSPVIAIVHPPIVQNSTNDPSTVPGIKKEIETDEFEQMDDILSAIDTSYDDEKNTQENVSNIALQNIPISIWNSDQPSTSALNVSVDGSQNSSNIDPSPDFVADGVVSLNPGFPAKTQTHGSYSTHFKLTAVEWAEKNGKQAASRKFKVASKNIRYWCNQKEQLLQQAQLGLAGRKRLSGGGRKPMFEAMENQLIEWILDERQKGHIVARKDMKSKAMDLYNQLKQTEGYPSDSFEASNGWLFSFLRRCPVAADPNGSV